MILASVIWTISCAETDCFETKTIKHEETVSIEGDTIFDIVSDDYFEIESTNVKIGGKRAFFNSDEPFVIKFPSSNESFAQMSYKKLDHVMGYQQQKSFEFKDQNSITLAMKLVHTLRYNITANSQNKADLFKISWQYPNGTSHESFFKDNLSFQAVYNQDDRGAYYPILITISPVSPKNDSEAKISIQVQIDWSRLIMRINNEAEILESMITTMRRTSEIKTIVRWVSLTAFVVLAFFVACLCGCLSGS